MCNYFFFQKKNHKSYHKHNLEILPYIFRAVKSRESLKILWLKKLICLIFLHIKVYIIMSVSNCFRCMINELLNIKNWTMHKAVLLIYPWHYKYSLFWFVFGSSCGVTVQIIVRFKRFNFCVFYSNFTQNEVNLLKISSQYSQNSLKRGKKFWLDLVIGALFYHLGYHTWTCIDKYVYIYICRQKQPHNFKWVKFQDTSI